MSFRPHRITLGAALALGVASPALAQTTPAIPPTAPAPAKVDLSQLPFTITEVATFDYPWSMAFLPDGKQLVTQKRGAMILFDPRTGDKKVLLGTPTVVSEGQAALMDVVLAPDFAASRQIYFSFSEPGEGKETGTALATATLDEAGGALKDLKVIFRATPNMASGAHYSGRIAIAPDQRSLFFTNGERAKFDPAQDPKSTLGKVLHLNLDGTPAAGNPLAAKGFHPAIWTYGQRNLTGLAFDANDRLWQVEMGPLGGDELNLVKAGGNYGWPTRSYGDHYDKRPIPDHSADDGFEKPKLYWNPSLAPSSLAYYNADLFAGWKNSLFITGLSGQALVRISLDGETATKADHWRMGMRLRNVRVGPDGALWLLEDSPKGRMLKLTPKG
ncbi:glucose/arabinose dehydrogenase [Sphingobium sp. B1D7B]|uniref:PQQ-dependent sugar dehydrogenase n=1 Tax=unclassified Sphingobium TaxID=2611147 RepID=UPI00222514F7|nr:MULTISPECIES: PQQ-dependent sugar dehydrogenase [unclassified Sphingobium]MCW2393274.1 glucose/arabinose dehydrogenase [Sphingobium sp. B11D3A]MCW2405157.1 glucose/arabinose dehydrogenase [Sphingobium sp. B1D7B]